MTARLTVRAEHAHARPARARWLTIVAAAWAGMIAYGSLMPFRLRMDVANLDGVSGHLQALVAMLVSPRWQTTFKNPYSSLGNPNWLTDVMLNIALYLPLGALLYAAQRAVRRSGSRGPALVRVVLLAGLLSYAIECTQSLMPDRHATLNDMVANITGALLGAALMPWVYRWFKRGVFAAYTRAAHGLEDVAVIVDRLRRRPLVIVAFALTNVMLVVLWYARSVDEAAAVGRVNWLPFAAHFDRSYDVAMLAIGRSIIVYCLLGLLLSLPLLRVRQRHVMGLVVLGVALLAAVREVMHLAAVGQDADITEPLLAAMAAGMVLAAGWLVVHAVRSSCRRRRAAPVEVDRRRRPHVYQH